MRAAASRGRKAVPARLLLLVALAMTLAGLSITKLRAAWSHTAIPQQQEVGLSLAYLRDSTAQVGGQEA